MKMKMKLLIQVSFLLIFSCHAGRIKKDPLSDHEHLEKGDEHVHDSSYDHDAFLGKKTAKEFDDLTPEESKEKLGELFHKVDSDSDNFVTEEEMKKWITKTQNRYMIEDTDAQMKLIDADKDGYVSWDEYWKNTYDDTEKSDDDHTKKTKARDEKRFKAADEGGDLKLKAEEFSAFLHPESYDKMKGYVAEETLEDIDKNNDGVLSLEEYMNDLYPLEDRVSEKEPEWLEKERTAFLEDHDKNKDGILNVDEVGTWIMPDDGEDRDSGIDKEAQHLMTSSDTNKDGKLSKKEVLENYDIFVGSQFTDYGDLFNSDHTEL